MSNIQPTTDYTWGYDPKQLPDLYVSKEQYDRWKNNCEKNKSATSWMYFTEPYCRRRVYMNIFGGLVYKGVVKGTWGIIKKIPETT